MHEKSTGVLYDLRLESLALLLLFDTGTVASICKEKEEREMVYHLYWTDFGLLYISWILSRLLLV